MLIDENTKIIGRFHTKPSPRGLNIYNPFLQSAGLNAIYLLFYNPNPKPLIDSMRVLRMAGAVTAGFESDPKLPKLLDELDDGATYVGKVGFITNKSGKLKGYNQSGTGLLRAIEHATHLQRKRIVIVGAGNVVKSLLFNMAQRKLPDVHVELYNRTISKAENIAKDFTFVQGSFPLSQLHKSKGDILVNATHLGGKEKDAVYTADILRNFQTVVDVTFETENTPLIKLAKKMGKKVATGWDMFTYQGQVVLETILETKISAEKLKKYVAAGLSETVM